ARRARADLPASHRTPAAAARASEHATRGLLPAYDSLREQSGKQVRELERLVALDAVAGVFDHDDARVGVAAPELGNVRVVYDRRQAPAHESEWHLHTRHCLPERFEAGHDAAALAFTGPAARKVVTPPPPTVRQPVCIGL